MSEMNYAGEGTTLMYPSLFSHSVYVHHFSASQYFLITHCVYPPDSSTVL